MTTYTAITAIETATNDLRNVLARLQDPNATLIGYTTTDPTGDNPEITPELANAIGDDRDGLLKIVAELKAEVLG